MKSTDLAGLGAAVGVLLWIALTRSRAGQPAGQSAPVPASKRAELDAEREARELIARASRR